MSRAPAGVVLSVIGALWLSILTAQAAVPVPEDATATGEVVQEAVERRYPMDGLRRISGRLRMDAKVETLGRLEAVTYRLSDRQTGLEAFTNAREHLLDEGAELLFWCEGRDCGSSSLWANEVFGRSYLYGPENQQAYLLARMTEPEDRLVALYGITRGSGRPYLHVETFHPTASLGELLPTAGTLLRQLHSVGGLHFPGLAAPSPAWRVLLARTLQLDRTLSVALSGPEAESWQAALVDEGVRAARLQTEAGDAPGLHLRRLR